MQLKTILNRVEKHSSFVYADARWVEGERVELEIDLRARRGSRAVCAGCERRGSTYDTLAPRRVQFVPLWGILVFFVYAIRRVDCGRCGVTVERVPWAEGKSPITTSYAWFLASWAKRLSWKEAAEAFRTSWDSVYRAVQLAVAWGLAHRNLDGIEAIGVDEVLWHRGHKYLTVVYQIDAHCRRLLWMGQDRKVETLEAFFDFLAERAKRLRFVCSRWCLLRNPENLTERQSDKLGDLLHYNLKSVRAYLLKEEFQLLWEYVSPAWAGRFLDRQRSFCNRVISDGRG
jgi:transposase